jgi:hypothetical protein
MRSRAPARTVAPCQRHRTAVHRISGTAQKCNMQPRALPQGLGGRAGEAHPPAGRAGPAGRSFPLAADAARLRVACARCAAWRRLSAASCVRGSVRDAGARAVGSAVRCGLARGARSGHHWRPASSSRAACLPRPAPGGRRGARARLVLAPVAALVARAGVGVDAAPAAGLVARRGLARALRARAGRGAAARRRACARRRAAWRRAGGASAPRMLTFQRAPRSAPSVFARTA